MDKTYNGLKREISNIKGTGKFAITGKEAAHMCISRGLEKKLQKTRCFEMRRRHTTAKCTRHSAQRGTRGWEPTLKKKKGIKPIDVQVHIEKPSRLPREGSYPAMMPTNQHSKVTLGCSSGQCSTWT